MADRRGHAGTGDSPEGTDGDGPVAQDPATEPEVRLVDETGDLGEVTGAMAAAHEHEVALVEALVNLGLPVERAHAAVREGWVPLALVRGGTSSAEHLDLGDVADQAGVDPQAIVAYDLAVGGHGDRTWTTEDVETARNLKILAEAIGLDAVLQVVRTDSEHVTRLAMAHLGLVMERLVDPLRREGADDVAVALAMAEAARTLIDPAGQLLGAHYRRALEELLASELIARAVDDTEELDLAVGFVDVVGYTSLSARVDPSGLDEVLEAFEARCRDIADAHASVQLIKLMGDAALYISTSVHDLATVILQVVDPVEGDNPLAESPVRGGMAAGPVLLRRGDAFGTPVNLAARLTDRSRPSRLLAAADLEGILAERFTTKRVKSMKLRGLGTHRPVAVSLPAG